MVFGGGLAGFGQEGLLELESNSFGHGRRHCVTNLGRGGGGLITRGGRGGRVKERGREGRGGEGGREGGREGEKGMDRERERGREGGR